MSPFPALSLGKKYERWREILNAGFHPSLEIINPNGKKEERHIQIN